MEREQLLNLCRILGQTKDLKRRGWLKRNVSNSESDGDHMFSTAFLVLMLAPPALDRFKCLAMALTHDLQEVYAGDTTPGEKSAELKHEMETSAIKRIAEELAFPDLVKWFDEFEQQQTPEACFVKALDKLDAVLMAYYYDMTREGHTPVWEEFSSNALELFAKNNNAASEFAGKLVSTIGEVKP